MRRPPYGAVLLVTPDAAVTHGVAPVIALALFQIVVTEADAVHAYHQTCQYLHLHVGFVERQCRLYVCFLCLAAKVRRYILSHSCALLVII